MGTWCFCLLPSDWAWVYSYGVCSCSHLKSALYAIILWDSWMQAPLESKAFKAGMLDMWCKPVTPQGEDGSWWFPSGHMVLCQQCRSMVKMCHSLSYQFWCEFHSHPMCGSHSISFLISLRGNCSMCSCIFSVSMGGGKFRKLLCYHLGLEYSLGGTTLKHMFYTAFPSFSAELITHYPPW